MLPESREIGSEFHWDPAVLLTVAQNGHLPPRHSLYATGCGALTVLLRRLTPAGRLHVPSFFCPGVAEALSVHRPLAWYRHLPGGPSLETLRTRPGDVVLAQNLFGREDGAVWRDWITAHPDVTVIEDHSHDPFGPWARTSIAPYAVASLRKTLPVPDGGLLWSPRGLDLPAPSAGPAPGSDLKLAAMVLKAAWLAGHPVAKDAFRALQQQGEHALLGSEAAPSAFTAAVLPVLDIAGLRAAATRNARALEVLLPHQLLLAAPGAHPRGAAPFRVQLLCPDEPARDELLRHLAGHGIYAPVHWRQPAGGFWSGDPEAAALAGRILTVPADHRCTAADVHRVAALLALAAV
ncbi:hypothetical protein Aab01nite_26970 [Paractinoplanes abujensis]|uniref:dTDP-4-amino-4,6-dideoxygalactose transaminase n=1 Tax=Paractinoplanes abujensis TaxID=882441 RepID=A0A7W7G6T7_9ACTN|nr:hypothetical protein [Actinoplanes abujensis]MBB4698407.1 hypothetical protein [Actinoplanes abujensis]GID19107.1 hypothetical protein Aab01nite_26970 [Actinoplanes abujensis]